MAGANAPAVVMPTSLRSAPRIPAHSGRTRASWLCLGALAIGGTGIWVMHFIAMLGFSVPDAEIRYNVPLTLLSAGVAIAMVGAGLFTVGLGGPRAAVLAAGGIVTGLGVAAMHYMGMAAMRMSGHVDYSPLPVLASVLIAVGAATAALWFTLRIRGGWATAGAALIMGVAVCGMHYTGMTAMQVELHHSAQAPSGARAFDFLAPLLVIISCLATFLLVVVALAPSEDELRAEADQDARIGDAGLGAGMDGS